MKDETAPKRADGRKNRDAILRAAAEVFASEGINVPLDRIAVAAGVGRATLYRNFPDREALALAVFDRNVVRYEAAAPGLLDSDGFERMLTLIMADVVSHAGLGQAMIEAADPTRMRAIHDRVIAVLMPLVCRAQEAGHLRADIGDSDLALLLAAMAGGVLPAPLAERRAQGARLLDLFLTGLRPGS